jgi:hypothetical protein
MTLFPLDEGYLIPKLSVQFLISLFQELCGLIDMGRAASV